MTTGHIFIAQSLDGFIARPDHGLDWLMKFQVEDDDNGYGYFISSMDCIVMGRGSFLNVLSFGEWPYELPVIVLSNTLSQNDIPENIADKVILSQLSPPELMGMLTDLGWNRAYIDGGQVIQSFLRDDLIDDMVLTQIPILIGKGIPLFGELDRDVDLLHMDTSSAPSGLVSSFYKVVKKPLVLTN
ncbi:MAG: dihydrofolate reductase family protein [Paracoccaceae bacterium]|nr:dihydrofolate reductase family protein [Paracoccaceae bacterium]